MAKSLHVNVSISRNGIPEHALTRSLQEMHIEAVKEILGNMELTDRQLCHLLTVVKRNGRSGK
ncbi:MAG: hypothetical protein K1W24_10380 [Lachnospiraceae bacterium]